MSEDLPIDEFVVNVPPRISHVDELNHLLYAMVKAGGSDLFFMTGSPAWMSRYGRKRLLTMRKIAVSEVMTMLAEIYGSNAQSQMGRVKPLDFSHEFRNPEDKKERFRFRVNAVGAVRDGSDAVTVTFRTIPTTPPLASELGVEADIMEACNTIDQGLILVVGATGNGKSTLLASILREQMEEAEGHRNFVTIESPIEFVYDSVEKPCSLVTQSEVGRHVESFSHGVVNALRMAPDVILVGESRDYETVSATVEASMTGHAVYSTVHSNNVAETLRRLVAVYPDDLQGMAQYDLVGSTKMIVAQRLINSVDGKRIAIREYLDFSSEVKNALQRAKNIGLTAASMVAKYGRPMVVDAQEKYEQGIISQDVYERVRANYELEMSNQ